MSARSRWPVRQRQRNVKFLHMWSAFKWAAVVCAALAAAIQIGPAASANDGAVSQGITDERPLKPASNEAIIALLVKRFWVLQKLEPIPIAVTYNGVSDLDLQTWPGRLIVEKIRSIELECGLQYRFVSLSDDYRALLSLGTVGPDGLVAGEQSRRDKALGQLRQLLGATAPILNGQLSHDSRSRRTQSTDGTIRIENSFFRYRTSDMCSVTGIRECRRLLKRFELTGGLMISLSANYLTEIHFARCAQGTAKIWIFVMHAWTSRLTLSWKFFMTIESKSVWAGVISRRPHGKF